MLIALPEIGVLAYEFELEDDESLKEGRKRQHSPEAVQKWEKASSLRVRASIKEKNKSING
uniref:Uncharacterized protein n=1 Tax=Utricularia reniformis TaxID=192314 RepID=A0A1Y0B322_9LAMI|nr:hypothetical protein AEK19_MT1651 [Utricularia reniformis]ART31835.1 hypothetical protein AEK19_MT1651 [Utricularia reniformis]